MYATRLPTLSRSAVADPQKMIKFPPTKNKQSIPNHCSVLMYPCAKLVLCNGVEVVTETKLREFASFCDWVELGMVVQKARKSSASSCLYTACFRSKKLSSIVLFSTSPSATIYKKSTRSQQRTKMPWTNQIEIFPCHRTFSIENTCAKTPRHTSTV